MWKGKLRELDIEIKYLHMSDLTEVENVQQQVIAQLERDSQYEALTTTEFQKILTDRTMIGAFYENQLIAFRALLIPPIDDEHLGRDINWPEALLDRVVYQEVTNVHPHYRGYGLQTYLGKILMRELEKDTRFLLVCATVSPTNIASLKDKFSLGLRIGALKEKYGGKMRYIFFKELRKPWALFRESLLVEMTDIDQQQQVLGKGYIGTGIVSEMGRWLVRYEK